MKLTKSLSVLLLTLSIIACDQPTAPTAEVLDAEAIAQLAVQVAEDSEVRMPHLGALLKASREALETSDDPTEAVEHFRRARRLGNAAEDARLAGDWEEARELARRSHNQLLMGIVAALGRHAVEQAVAGSAAGLARVEARIEGREVSERVTRTVERVRAHVAAAGDKLAADATVAALGHALAAAEGIRGLSPRYVARKSIARATSLLRQARDAVAGSATDEEIEALRRAFRLLNVAKDELEAGHPRRAADAANRSSRLSWGVLQGRAAP